MLLKYYNFYSWIHKAMGLILFGVLNAQFLTS